MEILGWIMWLTTIWQELLNSIGWLALLIIGFLLGRLAWSIIAYWRSGKCG